MAQQRKDKNFIGVDVKGARIWKGAKIAIEEQLEHVAFVRMRIERIARFFGPGEISEIWITFPDPFLKKGKANRRLTSLPFLNLYRTILHPEGIVHLKTDDPTLYEFTLDVIEKDPQSKLIYQSDDIYAAPLYTPELNLKTYYENMHLAQQKTIKYVRFSIHYSPKNAASPAP